MSSPPSLATRPITTTRPTAHGSPAWRIRLFGLALVLCIGFAAMAAGSTSWLAQRGLGALTLAILIGIVLGNTVYGRIAATSDPGVAFAKHWLLRAGIVLYGLRLSLQDIAQIGVAGVAIDAAVIVTTFGLACWVGRRWLGLERDTAMLIGVGASICGAAAVLGTQPVLRARAEQVTVAVATVVVFGTLSMLLVPLAAAPLTTWLGGAPQLGVYIGSTVHEVAQVVAAAGAIGPEIADAAVIAKMVRVLMLAPFLVALSLWQGRQASSPAGKAPIAVPWFAVGFVAVVVLSSWVTLPRPLVDALLWLDTLLLATAMAALGIGTQWTVVRRAGPRPLLLAGVLFVWLVAGGLLINRLGGWLFAAP